MDAYRAEKMAQAIAAGEVKEWPWRYYKILHEERPFAVIRVDLVEDLVEALVDMEEYTADFTYVEITFEEYDALCGNKDMLAYAEELYIQHENNSADGDWWKEQEASFEKFNNEVVRCGIYVREMDSAKSQSKDDLLISVGEKSRKDAQEQVKALNDLAQSVNVHFYYAELSDAEYARVMKTAKKLGGVK